MDASRDRRHVVRRSAWPAAVALAVGRGQLLRTIDGDFGSPNGTLDAPGLARLENRISRLCAESGLSWEEPGDDIDAFTICRSMPVRTKVPLPRALRPDVPAAPQVGSEDPIAVIDLLCRRADGVRWALPGWIFGSSERSIYMAMCSLFIDRESVLLLNTYGDTGNWKDYSIDPAAELLERAGFDVAGVHDEEAATIEAWRRLMMSGPRADVLFMNTSGSPAVMNMAQGTVGSTRDVPALSMPLALHKVHSYSLFAPDTLTTIGAKWLDRGVYAYVGSCDEPYLPAFVTPQLVATRIVNFSPFLAASRKEAGPLALPWRVVTIGDPLMLIEPPERRLRTRVPRPMPDRDGLTDVRRSVLEELRSRMESSDPVVTADALRDLHLLGQDELASKLWMKMQESADRSELTPERARAALPNALLSARGEPFPFRVPYRRRTLGGPGGDAVDAVVSSDRCDRFTPRPGALPAGPPTDAGRGRPGPPAAGAEAGARTCRGPGRRRPCDGKSRERLRPRTPQGASGLVSSGSAADPPRSAFFRFSGSSSS